MTHAKIFLTVKMPFTIKPITNDDRAWVRQYVIDRWGAEIMITRGEVMCPHEHEGFIALDSNNVIGLITYRIAGEACEVTSLASLREGQGIGTALVIEVVQVAKAQRCKRIWLITTNDNIRALAFYQKRGFVLAALHCNAVAASRKLKPAIPLVAENGIPIRDEIEMEMRLET
jgi:ribosomal protein S18 acetylase RimI-like enzyme